MPEVTRVVRQRRKRQKPNLRAGARLGVLLLGFLPILLGVLSLTVSRLYLELTYQVPAVEDISAFFDDNGLIPSVVIDRNDQIVTVLSNSAADERRWVGLSNEDPIPAPDLLVKMLVADQDPSFWENPGYVPTQTTASMVSKMLGRSQGERSLTITEQLVEATLLPFDQYPPGSLRRDFRRALLAERISNRFDKSQILEWYLNGAYFGNYVYGVDSASLVYFGKHANGLTTGEMAVLVSLADSRIEDPLSASTIREFQRETLSRLVEAGVISQRQARQARAQPLSLRDLDQIKRVPADAAVQMALAQAEQYYGRDIQRRGGLSFVTTLDWELQVQVECVLATQLERLGGSSANANVPARDGSPCLASGLLPPVRPSDSGVDRQVSAGSAVFIDPVEGALRAYVGVDPSEPSAGQRQEAGELLHPFIYLTAFSRGFSPGSMVLDLPDAGEAVPEDLLDQSMAEFEGPVRMRQALRAGLQGAAADTVDLAGYESVIRIVREFGLLQTDEVPAASDLIEGSLEVDPLSAAFAYGVLANEGVMVGRGNGNLSPIVLERVEDRFGRSHPLPAEESRAILSQGLAFLINDVLLDPMPVNRNGAMANGLGLNQPTAWIPASSPADDGVWTVAYSPVASLAVWFGNPDGSETAELSATNSTNPTAAAIMRYATSEQPNAIWQRPSEIAEVEVCDPSGLLPTSYCPDLVSELFLQGTEPTSFDNLYQPFRLNRETGNLATLATPLELVEERVYLIPPPEAAVWAETVGLEQPPQEYDPLPAVDTGDAAVNIQQPDPFDIVRGELVVKGDVRPESFDYYRVQVGAGLNPTRWIQIGEDRNRRVWSGTLATWDTEALSGLYTLQLVVVLEDGTIRTASVPVTVDNLAPQVSILQPEPAVEYRSRDQIRVEAAVEEGLGLEAVVFSLEDRIIARMTDPPFEVVLSDLDPGRYELTVEATDRAGNTSEPAVRQIVILP